MGFGTKLIHNGFGTDKITGAVSVPIYQASTFHQDDIENMGKYDYARSGNPTREALENTMSLLEGGDKAFAFSSGMAAISSVFATFSAGDHILICEEVYGGTYRAVTQLFNRYDIEFTFIDVADLEDVKSKIKENTKAIFLETPSNPLLKITDLKEYIRIAKDNNLLVIVDNTFMSPYLQRPIELGADIVVHSATKFLGGHSDVVAGIAVVKGEQLAKKVYQIQNGFGAILGPQDCWLLMRGIKTLKVRLDYQQKNAEKLASWLVSQDKIDTVYYPTIEGHPGREIHLGQADGGGAVLSFKTKDEKTAVAFLKRVKNAAVAVSLGGVETIVSYPVKMSHASVSKEDRERLGVTSSLIRVSVGLEDYEDLIQDFIQALK